jgi:hypothetical protein
MRPMPPGPGVPEANIGYFAKDSAALREKFVDGNGAIAPLRGRGFASPGANEDIVALKVYVAEAGAG